VRERCARTRATERRELKTLGTIRRRGVRGKETRSLCEIEWGRRDEEKNAASTHTNIVLRDTYKCLWNT
jgi:hypothetical protein